MPASCMHGVGVVVWPGRRLLLRPVSGELQPSAGSDPDPGSRWPHGTSQSAAPASSPRARLVQPPRAARADLPIARPSLTSLAPPPFPPPSPGRDQRSLVEMSGDVLHRPQSNRLQGRCKSARSLAHWARAAGWNAGPECNNGRVPTVYRIAAALKATTAARVLCPGTGSP